MATIDFLDTNFPHFNGDETTEEKVKEIQDYLYMLLESLRYALNNLGAENFNQNSLSMITDPIIARISDAEGNIHELEVTAEGLTSRVTSAEGNISVLEQTATSLSSRITNVRGDVNLIQQTLDGVVFYDSDTGMTVIDGSHITTGTIEAQRIGAGTLNLGNGTIPGRLNLATGGFGNNWVEYDDDISSLSIASADGSIMLSCMYYILLYGSHGLVLDQSMYGPLSDRPAASQAMEGQIYFVIE